MISIFNQHISILAFCDFDLHNIEVHNFVFPNGCVVDCTNGRKQHLLHLMLGAKRTYFVEGGEIEIAGQQVLLIPHGTAYSTIAHSVSGENCAGIGISFDACLKDGTPLCLPLGIYHSPCGDRTRDLFFEIDRVCKDLPIKHAKLKSLIFALIAHLAKEKSSEAYLMIKPALELMAATFTENLPIRVYAEKCNLSESYFRKNFKVAVGVSAIEYRNELRFAKAEQLYQSGSSIKEIAEAVGFCDAVFFSKLYKKRFGSSMKNRLKSV